MLRKPVIAALASVSLVMGATTSAHAMNLYQALQKAAGNNPQLQAQKATVDQQNEAYKIARAPFMPDVELNGSWAAQHINADDNVDNINTHPLSAGVTLTQTLFKGGSNLAGLRAARNQLMASEATLKNTQQQVFDQVVSAYVGVLRDQEVVNLDDFQVKVLKQHLDATRSRFKLGDVTKTDVSQAEARLAEAQAAAVQAEGELMNAHAVFEQVIGVPAENLSWPHIVEQFPGKSADVMDSVLANHPLIEASLAELSASKYGIDAARGNFMPTVAAEASYTRNQNQSTNALNTLNDYNEGRLMLTAQIPLFKGGANVATYKQSLAAEDNAQQNYNNTRRQVRANLIDALNTYKTDRAQMVSLNESVRANKMALDGVQKEAEVGSRTVLDLLDAQNELLQAEVARTSTHADSLVSAFSLLSAMGRFTTADLPAIFKDASYTPPVDPSDQLAPDDMTNKAPQKGTQGK